MNKIAASIVATLATMFGADAVPKGNGRARAAYPEAALKDHPGANPNRGRWGNRGYCFGSFEEKTPRGLRTRVQVVDASRWMPHIGAKQRAKGAARVGGSI